jgi:hypothetical protein
MLKEASSIIGRLSNVTRPVESGGCPLSFSKHFNADSPELSPSTSTSQHHEHEQDLITEN